MRTRKPHSTKKLTNEQFIERIKVIHPNITPLEEYTGTWKKSMRILCNECGNETVKSVSALLHAKQGCKICARSKGGIGILNNNSIYKRDMKKKTAKFYIAELTNRDTGVIITKIGVTTQTLPQRYMNIRFLSNSTIRTLYSKEGDLTDLVELERYLRIMYDHKQHQFINKWMGSGECFDFSDGDIKDIIEICNDDTIGLRVGMVL